MSEGLIAAICIFIAFWVGYWFGWTDHAARAETDDLLRRFDEVTKARRE